MKTIKWIISLVAIGMICECNEARTEFPEPNPNVEEPEEQAATEQPDGPYGQIEVMGWYGVPASYEHSTPENYRIMKEAGFTLSLSWGESGAVMVQDKDRFFSMLDAAQLGGMKMVVYAAALETYKGNDLRRLLEHPALYGFIVKDEPTEEEIPALGEYFKQLQAIDNTHLLYTNLFGNGSDYRAYVQKFLQYVPAHILSYDNYPIMISQSGFWGDLPVSPIGEKFVRWEYYGDIEIIADEARKTGIPLWAVNLGTGHEPSGIVYPKMTLNDLRFQAYSNLAYGAQGIQYYTYWLPPWSENYHDAAVDLNGNKTDVYESMKQVNGEIKALAKVFAGSRVVWVAHTGNVSKRRQPDNPKESTIPWGCTELDMNKLPPVIKSFAASGTGALVSLMERGRDHFLIVVNHDIAETTNVQVKGDDSLRRIKYDGSVVIPDNRVHHLEPGNALIYFWKE